MSSILTVNGAAKILEVTAQTVREYDRLGLLKTMRTDNGMRLFLRDDVERLAAERAAERAAKPAGRRECR